MLKNLRRPDWTTDSSATAVVCVVIVDVVIKICQPTLTLTSAYLRKPIFAYLKELFILYQYVSISYFSDSPPPPKSPRPTHKKIQFYNRPTVHSRFQSVSPQQTPSKPIARHHVAAEQEAQDFRPRRPALALLTP